MRIYLALARFMISIAFLLLTTPTQAETYKCTMNGKNVYSDRPCGEKQTILSIGDNPADKERLEEANRRLNEMRANQGAGDDIRREAADRAMQRRQGAAPSAPTQRQSKAEYCNNLLKTAKDAKDESNKWRYHQGLIDDAKRRQKEAEDEHFSNCYGHSF